MTGTVQRCMAECVFQQPEKVRVNMTSTQYSAISAAVKFDKFSDEKLSRVMRKPTFWFPTWSDTNQAVQLQKMARGLKFRI